MAKCRARQLMVDDIAKRAIVELKKTSPDLGGPAIKVKAYELAEQVVDRAKDLSEQEVFDAKDMTASIRANASQAIPLTKDKQPYIEVSKEVQLLTDQFNNNKSNDNFAKLLNAEIAHGYRNAKGESLVKLTRRITIGSRGVTEPISHLEFEEYYIDTDGSVDKTVKLNEAFIELDKANMGENFNEAHSNLLTTTLNTIRNMVNDFKDKDVTLKRSTLDSVIEAQGHYDPNNDSLEVRLDLHGPAAEFRNNFSMTNQEVYVHESIHAVMDFVMSNSKNIAKDVDIIAFKRDLKDLYAKATKESTWETLLPGINDGVVYTEYQKKQAQDKWDYIFNDTHGNGLHEFMAAITTNAMFREGMRDINAVTTNTVKDSDTVIDKLRKMLLNIIERIVGFAKRKGSGDVTTEGADLVFKLMRANYQATEKVAGSQTMETINKGMEKAQEVIEMSNKSLRQITKPLITLGGALDETIESKGNGVLSTEDLTEFVSLKKKMDKLIGKANDKTNTGNFAVVLSKDVYDIMNNMLRIILAMPTVYKMNQLTKGAKASRAVAESYAKTTNAMFEAVGLLEQGMIRSIGRDFLTQKGAYNQLADAILKLTKAVDEMREKTYEDVLAQSDKDWFEGIGINNDILNLGNNESLTDVVLRTDIQSLGLTAEELLELLKDSSKVQTKIDELSQGLSPQQLADIESQVAYMVTGVGTATNAANIADGFGGAIKSATDETIKQIDQLISYKALDATADSAKNTLRDFMTGESYIDYSQTLWGKAKERYKLTLDKPLSRDAYTKQVMKGVNGFIDSSIGLQVASTEEMRSNLHKRIKGYVKETYKSDNVLEFHPMSQKANLEAQGYVLLKEVKDLPGNLRNYGMFKTGEPAVKRANGALGLQDKKSRGLSLMDIIHAESDADVKEWDKIKKRAKFNTLFKATLAQFKADRNSLGMSPIYNSQGEVVDFRVTMSITDKKQFLDMETRGTENLAKSWGTMGTADATTRHNESTIDILFDDYENNYNEKSKKEFITIEGSDLTGDDYDIDIKTPKNGYEELWARLPKATRAYASKKFGSDKIIINKKLLTIAFGEDDWSLSQAKVFDNLPLKYKKKLRHIESVWQDTMQIAKGNIVIKTPEVLLGNVWSNFKILLYVGVHPVKGLKLMLTAAKELKAYELDKRELGNLIRAKKGGARDVDARIRELTASVANNTVAPLMDAGLYQSIVEDVSTANENNKVTNWLQEIGNKVIPNETLNSIAQHLFLTQKTKPYHMLLKATQVSDFYFRYAQYYNEIDAQQTKYATEKLASEVNKYANKGLSASEAAEKVRDKIPEDVNVKIRAKAMRNAIDNYVNYEAPLEKHIRYGDAMGTWFFVKYFVRIQKVVAKFVKENPARVGADIAFQQFVTGDTADVLDASFFDKGLNTYNPFKVFERMWEVVSPSGHEIPTTYLLGS